MIRTLKKKDLKKFIYFCQKKDRYSDFYVTKNNKRFFLNNSKVAKEVFNNCLKHGNKCFIKEENNQIYGVLLITGYKDKFPRKYVKLLVHSQNNCRDLFRYLQWQKLSNLFIKTRKNNKNFIKYDEKTKNYKPSYFVRKSGFKIIAIREKEVLLKKEDYNREYNKHRK